MSFCNFHSSSSNLASLLPNKKKEKKNPLPGGAVARIKDVADMRTVGTEFGSSRLLLLLFWTRTAAEEVVTGRQETLGVVGKHDTVGPRQT